MITYWWVPAVVVMYFVYGWLTCQNNFYPKSIHWFYLMWFVGALPLWSWVSRFSKNLVLDNFLYDLFMLIATISSLILFGAAKSFSGVQYIGVVLCLIGILLMKLGG
jgi:fucose 4-O-acetylase-like acetyltransferase